MKYPRVLARMSAVGLTVLCRCSLFVDVNELEDGGAANRVPRVPDATTDTGAFVAPDDGPALETPEAAGDDSEVIEEAGGDDGGIDAPSVGEGGAESMDATAEAAGFDAASDAVTLDAPAEDVRETGARDAAGESAAPDAAADGAGDSASPDAPPDAGDPTLVAFYPFDEISGVTSVDASGNGHTATMQGGATFSAGIQGNAASMNGAGQYVELPSGIVSGLMSFSISAWFYLNDETLNSRVFDFGTGIVSYMFLTPEQMRFSITTTGVGGEQTILGPTSPAAAWRHVAVTLSGTTGTLYVNGAAQPNTNTTMTLTPALLGSTTADWLGRSQYPKDPYLNGKIDNFRIYSRALSAAEVQALFAGQM